VEEVSRARDGGQSDGHYPFENRCDGFEEDNDAEGSGGVVGGLAGLVEDDRVGGFGCGRVVSESYQGGEEFEEDRRVDEVDTLPYRVGDAILTWG